MGLSDVCAVYSPHRFGPVVETHFWQKEGAQQGRLCFCHRRSFDSGSHDFHCPRNLGSEIRARWVFKCLNYFLLNLNLVTILTKAIPVNCTTADRPCGRSSTAWWAPIPSFASCSCPCTLIWASPPSISTSISGKSSYQLELPSPRKATPQSATSFN